MSTALSRRVQGWWQQLHRFFADEIWEKRLDELPPWQAFRYRGARILYCTVRGLIFEETLHIRAAALTYFTVLSLVPLLAFAFALLKGFGAYDALVQETIRPYVLSLLAQNQALRQAFEKLLEFVEQTGVASLGFLGLLFLLYAATRLLRNVEGALNQIWQARSAREPLEQLRDYVAIIVVTPLSLMAAVALTTAGQALDLLRAAGETLGISSLLERGFSLFGPLVVLFVGLLFLYLVLPNVTVKLGSAAVGALIGSLAWYLVLIAHVKFQIGVARFNALYSGFAAFPVFLAWLHISWVVVLAGAQIAATHQHHRNLARRARLADADQAFREALCLSALLEIVRAFVGGTPHPTRTGLSCKLDAPEELLAQMLERLISRGMLVETSAPDPGGYALAKPPEQIRVKEVLDALRRSPSFDLESRRSGLDPEIARLWLDLDRSMDDSRANQSLRELVREEPGSSGAASAGAPQRTGGYGEPEAGASRAPQAMK